MTEPTPRRAVKTKRKRVPLDRRVEIRMSHTMIEALEAEAKRQGKPPAKCVRRAIARWLAVCARKRANAERLGNRRFHFEVRAAAEAAREAEARARLPTLEAARETLAGVIRTLRLDRAAPGAESAVLAALVVKEGDPAAYRAYLKNLKDRHVATGPVEDAVSVQKDEIL